MKISTNQIGNYSPALIQKNNPPVQKQESAQTEAPKQDSSVLSSKEKQFFAKMYPDKQNEIMDYHFYQRSGKMSGVSIGTIIDRRG
jgi:hypothetical protein